MQQKSQPKFCNNNAQKIFYYLCNLHLELFILNAILQVKLIHRGADPYEKKH